MFSSNGDGFVFHDRTGLSSEKEATVRLEEFPSPDDLWDNYRGWKRLTPEAEQIILQDYFDDRSAPRYCQANAINAATAKGRDPSCS